MAQTIDFNPVTMDSVDALTIMAHGVIVIVVTLLPMFIIIMREFNKFRDDRYIVSGHSTFDFIIVLLITIPIVATFYIVWNGILEIVIPDLKPIADIVYAFWNVDPRLAVDAHGSREWVQGILYSVKHIRTVFEMVAVIIVMMIMFFSVRISMALLVNYQDERGAHTSLGGLIFKSIVSMLTAWFALEFYNMGSKGILNHPSGGVWDVSILWVVEGFLRFFIDNP